MSLLGLFMVIMWSNYKTSNENTILAVDSTSGFRSLEWAALHHKFEK